MMISPVRANSFIQSNINSEADVSAPAEVLNSDVSSAPVGVIPSDSRIPNLRETLKCWVQQKVQRATGKVVDPDKVYLHRFPAAQSKASGVTVTHWEHSGRPDKSMTIMDVVMNDFASADLYGWVGKTQAIAHFASSNVSATSLFDSSSVSNFFSRLGLLIWDRTLPGYIYSKVKDDAPRAKENWRDLDAAYGIYMDGPEKGHYNAENELRLAPSALLDIIRGGNLQAKMVTLVSTFWKDYGAQWQAAAKAHFVDAARNARADKTLTDDDFSLLMQAGVPTLDLSESASQEQTQVQLRTLAPPAPGTQVLRFDINGYAASDILRFVHKNGREVLYVPGATPAFHTFNNTQAAYQWVVEQGRDPVKAKALAQHFSLAERQQGIFGKLSVNGVDKTLELLGSGQMNADKSHINVNTLSMGEDVFAMMAKQTQSRIESDIDTQMKSNSEVIRDDALGLAQSANAILSIPLAFLGPLGMAVNALSFSTQVGLETEKAVEGDTRKERQEGMRGAVMDVAMMGFTHATGLSRVSGPSTEYRVLGRGEMLNPHWDPSMDVYLEPLRAGRASLGSIQQSERPNLQTPRLSPTPGSDHEPASPAGSEDSRQYDSGSADEFSDYDDSHVLKTNPYQGNVQLAPGGYFNSMGMIERTDLPYVYRVEKTNRVDRRGSPERFGFMDSVWFGGPEKMMEGPTLIVSRTRQGAERYGDTEFKGNYKIFEIKSNGLKAVSIRENIKSNPQFTAVRQGKPSDYITEPVDEENVKDVAPSAFEFDEVHLSNAALGPDRIRQMMAWELRDKR